MCEVLKAVVTPLQKLVEVSQPSAAVKDERVKKSAKEGKYASDICFKRMKFEEEKQQEYQE
jgi:hypothetical protein